MCITEISYTNTKYVNRAFLLSKFLNFLQKSLIPILAIYKHYYTKEKPLAQVNTYVKLPAHVLLLKLFILFFKLYLTSIYNLSVMTDLPDL